ncbi:MAG: transposase [Anaerolineae bacterium]|nr:transposase [Anaerolineae bacterium]
MIHTYKYRLFTNKRQRKALDIILCQQRILYNAALEQRKTVYEETGKGVSYTDQWAHFRDVRHANPDTFRLVNATSLQQLLRRVDKAYRAFFRRLKAGETPGYPRFKGRNRFHSMEFKHGDGVKLFQNERGQVRLRIQNVGDVKVKWHRDLPAKSKIKHLVIKRSLGNWYVTLMVEFDPPPFLPLTGEAVGIDVGLKSLLTLSNGETVDNPRWLRVSLKRLRVLNRKLARQKKGGTNWRKTAYQLARLHGKIANQRRDFWHKNTRQLVNQYDLICIENLTLGFMTANRHLALSAHDAALGEFRSLLAYKAEEAGKQVVPVPPQYTSQLCSECGTMVAKRLSVRVHKCDACGLELDRDVNAARNILTLGLSVCDRTLALAGVSQEAPHF